MSNTARYVTLTDAELSLLDCKLKLAIAIREESSRRKLSAEKLAQLVGVSKARVEAILRGDGNATLDEMAGAFFSLGRNRADFADAIDTKESVSVERKKSGTGPVVRRRTATQAAPKTRQVTRRAAA